MDIIYALKLLEAERLRHLNMAKLDDFGADGHIAVATALDMAIAAIGGAGNAAGR